jgi:hypothetical protein
VKDLEFSVCRQCKRTISVDEELRYGGLCFDCHEDNLTAEQIHLRDEHEYFECLTNPDPYLD